MTRILTAVILAIVFCSCRSITGSGNIVTRDRQVNQFDGIKCSGSIDIEVADDKTQGVKIEADDNIISYVITKVEGGMLNVYLRSNKMYHDINVKVYVSAPSLTRLSVSGSGSIVSKNVLEDADQVKFNVSGSGDINALVDAPSVIAEISGSGSIKLKGRTKDLTCKISGSGDLKCMELLSENTTATVSSSGTAHVFASVNLTAKVSGSGNIYYSGNPTSPVIHKSGSGSVREEE